MNMKVVSSHQRLKLRIEDFFDISEERKQARVLIDALAERSHAWIFGGMIRDIGLFGRGGFTSDIDLVIDLSREDLITCLKTLNIHRFSVNKLGGLRFHYKSLDFDIWSINDTWAFKNQIVEFKDTYSLLNTTLMTWDSVLYDVKNKHVISHENYLHDLHRRRLELVLQKTPNEVGSVIKILRTIYNKRVQIIGPQLSVFLLQALQEHSYAQLSHYEYCSYRSSSFNDYDLQRLKERICHSESGFDVKICL
jgi:predicted nucleotidyltransferase